MLQIPVAFAPGVSPEAGGCDEYARPRGETLFFTYTTLTLYILPLLIIIPCYTSIAITMIQRSSETTNPIASNRYKRTTIRVLIVGVFFIVMWLPIHVVHLWMAFDPTITAQTPLYIEWHTIANVLMFINSSVNPYLYAFGGTSNPFIRHLKDIGQCCCCGIMKLMYKMKGDTVTGSDRGNDHQLAKIIESSTSVA